MKKLISVLLVFVCLFSLSAPAFALNSDTIEVQFISGTGEERKLIYQGGADGSFVVTEISLDGTIISQAAFDPSINEVTQTIASGQPDNSVYEVDNYFTPVYNETSWTASGSSTGSMIQPYSNISDPPVYDDGLPNSSVFPGYKYLGRLTDSYVTCDINRHIDYSNDNLDAYRFVVTPGTEVAALVSIIMGAFTGGIAGIAVAVATSLASSFIGAGVDTIVTGEVSYSRVHYTFKLNCNNSNSYSYKFCSCQEFWQIYREGDLVGYELKNGQVDGHMFITLYESAQFAVRTYLDGQVLNVCCELASA